MSEEFTEVRYRFKDRVTMSGRMKVPSKFLEDAKANDEMWNDDIEQYILTRHNYQDSCELDGFGEEEFWDVSVVSNSDK